jgi:hypothetical protein
MHLPLHDLGMALSLGKPFRSAFQQRRAQVNDSLTSAGMAAFGKPLLDSVELVLQRYLARRDLATGCGPQSDMGQLTTDKCGTITDGHKYWYTHHRGPRPVRAEAQLSLRERTQDFLAAQHLRLQLWGGDGGSLCAELLLIGPTKRTSAMHRNDAAELQILPGHPTDPPAQRPVTAWGRSLFLPAEQRRGPYVWKALSPPSRGLGLTSQALPPWQTGNLGSLCSSLATPCTLPKLTLGTPCTTPKLTLATPCTHPKPTLGTPCNQPRLTPGNLQRCVRLSLNDLALGAELLGLSEGSVGLRTLWITSTRRRPWWTWQLPPP